MDAKELAEMTDDELDEKLTETRKELFELAGVDEALAREALRLAGQKLPIKVKFVRREADLFES